VSAGHTIDRLRAARLGVLAVFLVCGAGSGTWFARIPAIQDKHGLDERALGLMLLGMSIGALIVLPIAGSIIARFGSDRVTIVAGFVFAVALPIAALIPTTWLLFLALALFGAGLSTLDIAMNAQAVEVEKGYGRSIMSSFHGGYSLGGLLGAGAAYLIAGQGIGIIPHFFGAGAAMALAVLYAIRRLLPVTPQPGSGPKLALPRPGVIGLALIAFSSFLLEGSIGDWSGVYLKDTLGASDSLATAGYGGFALTMTIMRFLGDSIAQRLGPVRVVRLGGLLGVVGLLIAVAANGPYVAIAGFAIVGIGMATVVPMAFSAAGNTAGFPAGFAIAAVAGAGYLSLLSGPPAIGFIAHATSMRDGLLVSVVCGLLIVALAGRTRAAFQSTTGTTD
jgi:MFS family permease